MEAWFNLLIIATVSLCANARGPLCLNCLAVRSPEECQSVTECRSTENCFTEHFLFDDELPAFSFGCRNTQECHNKVIHKCGLRFCQSCCTGDMCNNNICTNGTAPPTGTPCLDCTAVSSTDHCHHLTYCQEGEVCYSEEFGSDQHGLTYRLGCLKKPVCYYFGAEIIGRRRSATNLAPRHVCCETPGCNYEGSSQITTAPVTWNAKDCWELKNVYNISEDGVYAILTPNGHRRKIRCDMTTDGGGWTVFQRRGDGSVQFNNSYEQYKSLFGSLDGEFWMGNDLLYALTRDDDQILRVDICDWDKETRWAKYSQFSVGPPSDSYRLHLANYSGSAGDALLKGLNSLENSNASIFSTPEKNRCAAFYSSGWWFNTCFGANLNGLYQLYNSSSNIQNGIQWQTWINAHSFKGSEMKMRPSAANPSSQEPFTCPVI